MSAVRQVRWARRAVIAAAAARALLVALAAAMVVLAATALPAVVGDSLPWDDRVVPAAALLALAGAAIVLWRARAAASLERVALWVEEQAPWLDYTLVTAIDGATPSGSTAELERLVARHELRGVVRRRLARSLRVPAAAALASGAALAVISASGLAAGPLAGAGGVAHRTVAADAPNRLTALRLTMTPPAYARAEAVDLGDASAVSALAGARVEVRGRGPAEGIAATLADGRVEVRPVRGGWTASFTVPRRPAALELRDRGFRRVLVVATVADAPPAVRLLQPSRDTVLARVPVRPLVLEAEATDDVGVAQGWFEVIVSTGSGEDFSARTTTTPAVALDGAREAPLRATVTPAALRLSPGDVVSMRAMVRDANDVTGPGVAVSDTRTWRIVGLHENDSVSINAAPSSAADSSLFTQRRLILKTEALQEARPEITRESFERQSQALGVEQAKLRQQVGAIVARDRNVAAGGTEAMSTMTRQLQAAWDAMQQAETELLIAETETALPHMRRALVYLDSVRKAERLYLRSRPPRIVVDIAKVRLTGDEKGSSSVRAPSSPADTTRGRLRDGLLAALDLLDRDPEQAMNALSMLRVRALETHPEVAVPLGEAVDAMRSGRDATAPLVRARRVLDGGARAVPSSRWGVAW